MPTEKKEEFTSDMAEKAMARAKEIGQILKDNNILEDETTALAIFTVGTKMMVRHFGPHKLPSTVALMIDVWRRTEQKIAMAAFGAILDTLGVEEKDEEKDEEKEVTH